MVLQEEFICLNWLEMLYLVSLAVRLRHQFKCRRCFYEALQQECIPKIYGAAHGIKGILEENFYDIGYEDEKELELLKTTFFRIRSVRYKLADPDVDDTDFKRLLEVFKNIISAISFITAGTTQWIPAIRSASTCKKSVMNAA